jgi:delta1-piperideine-2-carboxylate reductase
MPNEAHILYVDLVYSIEAIFLAAGLNQIQAASVARVIAAGERDGCASHGIYRIEGCLRTLKAGKVDGQAIPALVPETGAIIRVDAKHGFSCAAVELGMPHLVERARTLGFAALVINNCTHFSALWYEVELVAAHALAGLAPAGGTKPLLGTNPFAFAYPRPGKAPYVFDFATSVTARGEIELHRRAGKPLPQGWAIDAAGHPTTDPSEALAGAMLPFGGHKGSALSTMIELMAGAMIGDLTSREALDALGTTTLAPRHGELILAFDPARFAQGGSGDPYERAEQLFASIADQGGRLPSARRHGIRQISEREGITLSAKDIQCLDRLLSDGQLQNCGISQRFNDGGDGANVKLL